LPDTFWQRECWDTQLRDERHYEEKWHYVARNPVRKGLAHSPADWPFAGVLDELRW
jgi:putative transposase